MKEQPTHLLEHEDGHIRFDCWCEPELVHDKEDHFILHKNKNRKTIINDLMFNN